MQVQVLMTEREPVGELLGIMTGLKKELHHLQQDVTMMKDNVTSELAVLEGTVPNSKEMQHMERNTIE
eukprot:5640675-Prorocentrum_lima.AAC.1